MGLVIHNGAITPQIAATLQKLCPFGALDYSEGRLRVNGGCKGCKLCVKNGPSGAVTWEDEVTSSATLDKNEWRGVAVYAERRDGGVHPVTLELLGKARELAAVNGHPVYALLIGSDVGACANDLLHYGVDKVYVYDDPAFQQFTASPAQ